MRHEFLRFVCVAAELECLDNPGVSEATRLFRDAAEAGRETDPGAELLRHGLLSAADVARVRRTMAENDGHQTSERARRTPTKGTPVLPDIESLVADENPTADADGSGGLSRYEIHTEIGRGGLGVVRLATDPDLGRRLAIKTLLPPGSERARLNFVAEARVTAKLEHPNIVPVHHLGRDLDGNPFLAMKRVDGRNLLQLIDDWKQHTGGRRKRMSPDQLRQSLEIFGKIAQAVSFAHYHGVIHRDIKPQNVMIGRFGEVLVMDWGLAKILHREQRANPFGGETLRTESGRLADLSVPDGSIAGSPAWMSPEQATGRLSQIDERTDVFALGATLYHLLTLEAPYSGDSLDTLLDKAAHTRFQSPRRRTPWRGIPRELDAIVIKAMSSEPKDRYASAREMLDDVERFAAHRPVIARRDGVIRALLKWGRRNPRASLLGVMTVVCTLAIAVILAVSAQQLAAADARNARLERESLLAKSHAAEVETASQREREALLRELVEEQNWAELGRQLGARLQRMRDAAMEEYTRRLEDALATGMTQAEFLRGLTEDERASYCKALDNLLSAWEANPGLVQVTARDWASRGLMHSLDGDHESAVEDFTRAIDTDPEHEVAWHNRGIDHLKLQRYDEAIHDFTEAIRVNASRVASRDDRRLLGVVTLTHEGGLRVVSVVSGTGAERAGVQAGDIIRSLNGTPINSPIEFRAWLTGNAKPGRSFTLKVQRGDEELELTDYFRASDTPAGTEIAQQRESAALVYRGVARSRLGKHEDAYRDFTAAIELRPSPDAFYNRGQTLLLLRKPIEALSDFDEAVNLGPDDPLVFQGRAMIHHLLGHTDLAVADYSRAIKMNGSLADLWLLRGQVRMASDPEGAAADFSRTIELDPDEADAWYYRGQLHQRSGRLDGALADFREATERRPEHWRAWKAIAHQLVLADLEGALRAARMALKHCDDPSARQELRDLKHSLGGDD